MWIETIMKNMRKKTSICLRIIPHYQNCIHTQKILFTW